MYCYNCGAQLRDSKFCPHCGTPVPTDEPTDTAPAPSVVQTPPAAPVAPVTQTPPSPPRPQPSTNSYSAKNNFWNQHKPGSYGRICPRCGQSDFELSVETSSTTTGKNFSLGQGCLGYLLFGPLGILCGLCGQGQQTHTINKTYYICKHCGEKFRKKEELVQEIENNKTSARNLLITCGVMLGLILVLAFFLMYLVNDASILLVMAIVGIVMDLIIGLGSLVNFARVKELTEELERQERVKRR